MAIELALDPMELVRYCPECSRIGDVDYTKHRDCCPDGIRATQIPRMIAEQAKRGFMPAAYIVTPIPFDEAWKVYERKGFKYGREPLANVRFGYEIAQGQMTPQHNADPQPYEQCKRAGGCVCGGDLPGVRAGCSQWKGN